MIKNKGCVYFFKHTSFSPIKIGYSSSESPIKRFEAFKTYAPYGAEIIGFIGSYNPEELEKSLHIKYNNKRLEGEWFNITVEEAEHEIEFNESVEDSRLKNEFQIAWAKTLKTSSDSEFYWYYNTYCLELSTKDKVFKLVGKFPKITVPELEITIGVKSAILYRYMQELKKTV
jgi:hypothetical protein